MPIKRLNPSVARKTGKIDAPKSLDAGESALVTSQKELSAPEKLSALGVDWVCAEIVSGKSQRQICVDLGIDAMALIVWLSKDSLRSARVREARTQSADSYADMAEAVLLNENNPQFIPRARELASHYRWMASKRRPADYGEKQQIDLNATVKISAEQVDANIKRLLEKAAK